MDGFSQFRTPDTSKKNKPKISNTSSPSGFTQYHHQQQQQQPWLPQYSPYQHGFPPLHPDYGHQPSYASPTSFNQYTINSSSFQNTNIQNREYQDSPETHERDAMRRVDYNHFVCAEDDEDEDIVQETPLDKTKEMGVVKGGGRKQKTKQEKRIPWDSIEEKVLLEGWIDVSEDGMVGTAQDKVGFWKKISGFFHEKMGKGKYRTADGLYSKFNSMNGELTKFMGILFKNTNARHSGWSDGYIYTHSLNEFVEVTKKSFKFTHLVDIARGHPKWSSTPPFSNSTSKRAKTSETTSSPSQPIELNDDDVPVFEEPRRPDYGKKKAGKLAAAARHLVSSSSSQSAKEAKIDMLNEKFTNVANIRQEQNDFKILGKKLDGISGQKLKVMQALQQRALERNMKYVPQVEDDEE